MSSSSFGAFALIAAAVFLAAALLTWGLRRYALSRGVLDVPNARSSHRVPTPRGGGLAIVAACLAAVTTLAAMDRLPADAALALLTSGAITASIGFWDDHTPLAARWRLAAHFLAAAAALAALGGMPPVVVFGVIVASGAVPNLLGALAIVWLLNLYNFMDGIDGIAGIEAVTVCAGGAVVSLVAGHAVGAVLCLLLGAASAGFVVWNLPPARIFMGDAGSGFLGIAFAVIVIVAAQHAPLLLWCWLILLGAFIVDATVTLLCRLGRGERVYEAHRTHAYQHAARALGTHRPVTLAFGAINLLWLLPVSLSVATGRVPGELGLAVGWLPLAALALRWRAGQPERR